MKSFLLTMTCVATLFATSQSFAQDQYFNTFTYNVAGLPEGISSAPTPRAEATRQISCFIKQFDIVNVQEDFAYHSYLYDACDDHPYRTPTSGNIPLGTGLNTLSRFPIRSIDRLAWNQCNGVDCLTKNYKGFSYTPVQMDDGVILDVYNLHAQAQTDPKDLEARRADMLQLIGYIDAHSNGRPVIVFGDTNTRYTRIGDNVEEFLNHGFKDAWLEILRGGSVPPKGDPLYCDPDYRTAADCEVVDKVLYRGTNNVTLSPLNYTLRLDDLNQAGKMLSDHHGIEVNWKLSSSEDIKISPMNGGNYGSPFTDSATIPATVGLATVKLYSNGNFMQGVSTTLSDGIRTDHQSSISHESDLYLSPNEYVTSMDVCWDKQTKKVLGITVDGKTAVSYVKLYTNQSRSISEGSNHSSKGGCSTNTAPDGWQIAGFDGSYDDLLRQVAAVYKPIPENKPNTQKYFKIQSNLTSNCMNVWEANMANGTPVKQYACTGGYNELWSYDDHTGLIRSVANTRFCLDTAGKNSPKTQGEPVIWECNAGPNQQFTLGTDGFISVKSVQNWVLSPYQNTVTTTGYTGGNDQRWSLIYPTLKLSKTNFTDNQAVTISWLNTAGHSTDWIGIYKFSDSPSTASPVKSSHISGTSGRLDFTGLTPGNYFATLLLNDSNQESSARVTFSVTKLGDIDGDGNIDINDRTLLQSAIGKCAGDANYLATEDFDGDGCITMQDYKKWYATFKKQ